MDPTRLHDPRVCGARPAGGVRLIWRARRAEEPPGLPAACAQTASFTG
jgi:hypothetical protein